MFNINYYQLLGKTADVLGRNKPYFVRHIGTTSMIPQI